MTLRARGRILEGEEIRDNVLNPIIDGDGGGAKCAPVFFQST